MCGPAATADAGGHPTPTLVSSPDASPSRRPRLPPAAPCVPHREATSRPVPLARHQGANTHLPLSWDLPAGDTGAR